MLRLAGQLFQFSVASLALVVTLAIGCSSNSDNGATPDGMGGVAGSGGAVGSGGISATPGTCAAGQLACGASCVDPATNNLHCGACNAACGPGSTCVAGACACPGGMTACSAGCVDATTDRSNCGDCGALCGDAQQCVGGACTCRASTTLCGASCVAVDSDPLNCGGCGVACSGGQVCSLGVCSDSCAAGLTQCGQSCVDVATSFMHCGTCDNACLGDLTCTAGACACAGGMTTCGELCVDTMTSVAHCGACNSSCGAGEGCLGGACSCLTAGQIDCAGTCTSTDSDPGNCGACGTVCGAGQSCQAGTCVGGAGGSGGAGAGGTSGATGGSGGACAAGLTDCGGSCVDTQTSAAHCGACGAACDLSCIAGVCQAVKACYTKTTVTAPLIADFETYDGTEPVSDWGFAFNAPAGSAGAVYSGLFTYSDGIGNHALTMVAGNAGSSYAPSIGNTQAGGVDAWGGGVGLWMGCIDASAFTGISLYVRGTVPTGTVTIALSTEGTSLPDETNPDAGGTCASDCADASIEVSVTNEWAQIIIPWSAFTPGTANGAAVPLTGDSITGITLNVPLAYVEDPANPGTYIPEQGSYSFAFDDLELMTGGGDCPSGQTLCGTACTNTSTNSAHCGACNNACATGQTCSSGGCTCSGGLTACGTECVDTDSNAYHCGACNARCLGSCSGGTCTTNACGATDSTPFACTFAWGANGNSGDRPSYLDFITTWIGYEYTQGRSGDCDGCSVVTALASSNAIPTYYGYIIGYSLPDCNTNPNGTNKCNAGAQYIRDHRAEIIDLYADYAQQSYLANPSKPVAWLLEGDFVQYTYAEQQPASARLTMPELGQLASDIVCAIKGAAPNALVAINHSPWMSDADANAYWNAMPLGDFDFVWTTGTGTNNGFINTDGNASAYNAATATYAWLSSKTGKGILVDTSFGPSQQADSWSSATAAQLNARIGEGVIAANVTEPPTDYQTRLTTLRPQLGSVCQ